MKVDRIDHLVLTVHDIQETCSFYSRVLGIPAITFGDGRMALKVGENKINLHEEGKEFKPGALKPVPGSADLCFITSLPLNELIDRLQSFHVEIIEGPVLRAGASGPINSVYIRDPDGNLIELSNYL